VLDSEHESPGISYKTVWGNPAQALAQRRTKRILRFAGESRVESWIASGYQASRLLKRETSSAPQRAVVWMVGSFLIAAAAAATVVGIFGAADHGIVLALRITARWSFLLFWLAYSGGALATLCGPWLNGLLAVGVNLVLPLLRHNWSMWGISYCMELVPECFSSGRESRSPIALPFSPYLQFAMRSGRGRGEFSRQSHSTTSPLSLALTSPEMPLAAGGITNYPLSYPLQRCSSRELASVWSLFCAGR
jgi:hypothetical protein